MRNIGVEGVTVTGGDGGALTRQLEYDTVCIQAGLRVADLCIV